MKNDPCWDGYEMIGTKKKNGKEVPNCVKESAPPGMEDWVRSNKDRFKEQYGDGYEEILYAKAWKMYKNKLDESEIKVGSSVHVGLKVKGGAGVRGTVSKIEGDTVYVQKTNDNTGKLETYRGSLKNTTLEESVDQLNEASPDENELGYLQYLLADKDIESRVVDGVLEIEGGEKEAAVARSLMKKAGFKLKLRLTESEEDLTRVIRDYERLKSMSSKDILVQLKSSSGKVNSVTSLNDVGGKSAAIDTIMNNKHGNKRYTAALSAMKKKPLSEAVMSYKDWLAKEKAAGSKGSKETQMYQKEKKAKRTTDFDQDAPATTPARSASLPPKDELEKVREKLKKMGIETSLKGITLYHKGTPKQEAKIRSALRHAGITMRVRLFESVESLNESETGPMAAEWKKIQSMPKGSSVGTREELRQKQKYLQAVYNYRKKANMDLKKAKSDLESVNQALTKSA